MKSVLQSMNIAFGYFAIILSALLYSNFKEKDLYNLVCCFRKRLSLLPELKGVIYERIRTSAFQKSRKSGLANADAIVGSTVLKQFLVFNWEFLRH